MKLLLIGAIVLVGCGPSWTDVVIHDSGVYEDTSTGECWVVEGGHFTPVECPKGVKS